MRIGINNIVEVEVEVEVSVSADIATTTISTDNDLIDNADDNNNVMVSNNIINNMVGIVDVVVAVAPLVEQFCYNFFFFFHDYKLKQFIFIKIFRYMHLHTFYLICAIPENSLAKFSVRI